MMDICRKFNRVSSCDDENCKKCNGEHAFCDLYNSGLLGIIRHDETTDDDTHQICRQKFLGPYDITTYEKGILPLTDNYYLVHPSLQG
jgi:hypothetical protein